MRIGILITSIGNFGQKGFYNAQEIGLAKALDKTVDEVKVYKLVEQNQEKKTEKLEGCRNVVIFYIPSKRNGINGIVDIDLLDVSIDVIVYFSDTQLAVPKVYKWAAKNKVKFIPYIGVTESHSTSKLKRMVMDFLFKRNLSVYRKSHCLVKTSAVEADLIARDVKHITVAPVGLDLSLMKDDYMKYSRADLQKKYGYRDEDKVLLFIGRMTSEKQPVKMIEIYAELIKKDNAYKLLMVGSGELKDAVCAKVKELGVGNRVQMIECIPNSDIWEIYCFADTFVNLNKQEIFGMAVLEAMYYGCKVVAWEAPGPNYIISNNETGYLAHSKQDVVDFILKRNSIAKAAHNRVVEEFTWDRAAQEIVLLAGD